MLKYLLLSFLLLSQSWARPCEKDEQAFCKGIDPGRGRMFQCLNAVRDQISKECKKEIDQFKVDTQKNKPCFLDIAQFCPKTDESKVSQCLLSNEENLSLECKKQIENKKIEMRKKIPCIDDIVKFCKEIKKGEGRITNCLIKNEDKLSPVCQKDLEREKKERAMREACLKDAEHVCKNEKNSKNAKDLMFCLEKNQKKLSPLCQEHTKIQIKKFHQQFPCYVDREKLCKDHEKPRLCLYENMKKLSKECAQTLQKKASNAKTIKKSCENDRAKYCKQVEATGNKIVKCLRNHKEKLSLECLSALSQ